MNENSIEHFRRRSLEVFPLSRSTPVSPQVQRRSDILRHFCALPNLQSLLSNVLQTGPLPLESTYGQPRDRASTSLEFLRTLTTDVHVGRADDSLPKELCG
jgi:hypothetical protein